MNHTDLHHQHALLFPLEQQRLTPSPKLLQQKMRAQLGIGCKLIEDGLGVGLLVLLYFLLVVVLREGRKDDLRPVVLGLFDDFSND